VLLGVHTGPPPLPPVPDEVVLDEAVLLLDDVLVLDDALLVVPPPEPPPPVPSGFPLKSNPPRMLVQADIPLAAATSPSPKRFAILIRLSSNAVSTNATAMLLKSALRLGAERFRALFLRLRTITSLDEDRAVANAGGRRVDP
jgi:hypothetical protein